MFPSDTYALQSQLRFHGFDPEHGLLVAGSRDGAEGAPVDTDSIVGEIDEYGDEIALALLSGVNYFSGQAFDMQRIAAAARARGCVVGFDLAHAAGNLILELQAMELEGR